MYDEFKKNQGFTNNKACTVHLSTYCEFIALYTNHLVFIEVYPALDTYPVLSDTFS